MLELKLARRLASSVESMQYWLKNHWSRHLFKHQVSLSPFTLTTFLIEQSWVMIMFHC